MKSFVTFVLSFLLLSISVYAQEETLLGNGEISNGGFGAPVVKYTQIKGEPALLIGGRGGWIINHTFVLGGGGYGLVTDVESGTPPVGFILPVPYYPYIGTYINLGYGGLELEYIFQSNQLLHFSVYALIGGGAVSFRGQELNDVLRLSEYDYDYPDDAFFVFEPAVNAELNVTSFMRIAAGFSYRFISGVRMDNLKNSDIAGPSGMLTFKFGSF